MSRLCVSAAIVAGLGLSVLAPSVGCAAPEPSSSSVTETSSVEPSAPEVTAQASQKRYDWQQWPKLLFYMVQTDANIVKMKKILPNNPYWAKWGGPHVTLGGSAPKGFTNQQVNNSVAQLKSIKTEDRKISGTIDVKPGSGSNKKLLEAHFASELADQAAGVLRENDWPSVEPSPWHVTLADTSATPVKPEQEKSLKKTLEDSSWTFVVNLRTSTSSSKSQWVNIADIDTSPKP